MRPRAGHTLVELAIAIAILGAAVGLFYTGLKLINTMSRQKVILDAHSDAERTLFMIERDILNSKKILCPDKVVTSSTTLQLTMRDFAAGFDTEGPNANPHLFDENYITTVTYQQRMENGVVLYLERLVDSPSGPKPSGRYLRNVLSASEKNYFTYSPNVEGGGNGYEIAFPLKPGFWDEGMDKVIKVRVRRK